LGSDPRTCTGVRPQTHEVLFRREDNGSAAPTRAGVGKDQDAALCSTGEQKALLLSLILAHAELVRAMSGRPLVILLDEVAAHLDPVRRAALFERLRATGGQVWMTGTEASLFAELGAATRLTVAEGRVEAG
jgi:DNA replication and repair protein RecF